MSVCEVQMRKHENIELTDNVMILSNSITGGM